VINAIGRRVFVLPNQTFDQHGSCLLRFDKSPLTRIKSAKQPFRERGREIFRNARDIESGECPRRIITDNVVDELAPFDHIRLSALGCILRTVAEHYVISCR